MSAKRYFDLLADRVIRMSAQQYSVRTISDPAEAKRLSVQLGTTIREPIEMTYKPTKDIFE